MSFKWSSKQSKYTMFFDNCDIFNKDGLFNIKESSENVENQENSEHSEKSEMSVYTQGSRKKNTEQINVDHSPNKAEKIDDLELTISEEAQMKLKEQLQLKKIKE
jgi:hypothetical protein